MKEILTKSNNQQDAAIDYHNNNYHMELDTRYSTLMSAFWNTDPRFMFPNNAEAMKSCTINTCPTATAKLYDYNVVTYSNKHFVIRNRALYAGFNVEKLDKASLSNQINAQIS